jgi:uncharacterized protein YndB with AHSA1/START domain
MKGLIIAVTLMCVLLGGANAQDIAPIVHEGVVDAPLDQVWTAFSTGEGLRSWLAPHAEIDLRVGGIMRSNYNASGKLGDPETIENTILSFEPHRMISIRVSRAPENFPFPNAVYQMWTVVYFDAIRPNQTGIREVSLGFTTDPESQRMRAFFQKGNATTLSQLQRHFARPR